MRECDTVLAAPERQRLLDFSRPVELLRGRVDRSFTVVSSGGCDDPKRQQTLHKGRS
jgi:hypothetical protein